jgi:hypothetical protein
MKTHDETLSTIKNAANTANEVQNGCINLPSNVFPGGSQRHVGRHPELQIGTPGRRKAFYRTSKSPAFLHLYTA